MNIKKLLALLLAMTLVLSLASCSGTGKTGDESDPPTKASPEEAYESDSSTEILLEETYEFEGISIELPATFHMDDSQGVTIAVPSNYPTETDNITFTKTNADNIDAYDVGAIDVAYTSAIEGYNGITDFEKREIAGTDAIYLTFLANVTNIDMHITQVLLFFEDRTIAVTFTDVTGNYTDAFTRSLESIKKVQ